MAALNSFSPAITFTHDEDLRSAHFLDVHITKYDVGRLLTSLYTKPTDAYMYLHYTSFHPEHQKRSIPYSQAVRIRRICSNDLSYDECTNCRYENLRSRGYPSSLIRDALNKSKNLNRLELLSKQQKNTESKNVIPFITTYNPYVPDIQKIFNNCLKLLTNNTSTRFINNS
jgi:hypothetical protein